MIGVATAGAIYSLYDSSDAHHIDFVRLFQRADLSIIIPSLVLAEADHLIRHQLGAAAQSDFLEGLVQGFFTVEPVSPADWKAASQLIRTHPAMSISLTDATLVAMVNRTTTSVVVTPNANRFRQIQTDRRLTVLPADL